MTDPRASVEASRDAIRRGDLIVAYDLARKGLATTPDSAELAYLAMLALARAGATEQAIREYARLGLGDRATSGTVLPALLTDIASLEARLLKDRALTAIGADRISALADAARAYQRAFETNPDAFPAVNAATLWRLAGDSDRAAALARAALPLCAGREGSNAEGTYWLRASEAEAALVLGDRDAAARAVDAAARIGAGEYASFAVTRRQLRLLCAAIGVDAAILAPLSAPVVIHFAGHRIGPRFPAAAERTVRDHIDRLLRKRAVGFGFGSLAAGADILFAEALLAAGKEIQVVMPFALDEFKKVSVAPAGEEWVRRFDACLARAASVSYATDDRYLEDDSLFTYGSELAMGLALIRARNLDAEARQMVVWDGVGRDALGLPAGTAVDVATWSARGLATDVIDPDNGAAPLAPAAAPPPPWRPGGREVRALLFGDVRGFSKLREEQLAPFLDQVLGRFARVLQSCGDDILFRNTWGDGLYAVARDVAVAAECALRLQEEMATLRPTEHGLPAELALRIGAHVGPVFPVADPVLGRRNYMGSHVSRTARIEPIAPVSEVYVTEAFAAALALHAPDRFATGYVGQIPAAKDYGTMRMYYLKRAIRLGA